jgi:hypothetical protein
MAPARRGNTIATTAAMDRAMPPRMLATGDQRPAIGAPKGLSTMPQENPAAATSAFAVPSRSAITSGPKAW